ncbi:MAG: hypothetical protein FWG89_03475 [Treponema sp.]|nr:hypothetical protein [Treponema sp.]
MKLMFLLVIIMLSSCISFMEKAGQMLDGSAFNEKRIAHYSTGKKRRAAADTEITVVQNKTGETAVIIKLGEFPMIKIRGSAPDANGEFYLTSLEYLSGSSNGWNEYSMEILGEGTLFLNDNAILKINEKIEMIQISSGRMHRYDTRITGSDALSALRNRRERILSTVEWMSSLNYVPKEQTINEFEKYWKSVLFPEIVSKKNRPFGWLQAGDQFIRAEDIKWNTSYTERIFPEELRPIRDSGILLRDWEEAFRWIYVEFEWERITGILSREIVLQKIK